MAYMPGTNTGHGHVWERPDGVKARCGGPGLCKLCSKDESDRVKFSEDYSPGGKHFHEGVGVNWTATNQLRFVERHETFSRDGEHYARLVKVLQQMWQGSNGTQKWEDVPLETEEG